MFVAEDIFPMRNLKNEKFTPFGQSSLMSDSMYACLMICLSVLQSACLPVSLTVCLPVSLTVCLPVRLTICLPVSLAICLPVSLTICLPVNMTICLPVSMTICLPFSLTICLCSVWQSACLSVWQSACLPARGGTLACAGEGVGDHQFGRPEKKPSTGLRIAPSACAFPLSQHINVNP
jgi:hypothetical protein